MEVTVDKCKEKKNIKLVNARFVHQLTSEMRTERGCGYFFVCYI